jgi:hypothetical protein
MTPLDAYCRVSARGINHLFTAIDLGGVCACGRKVFAFALHSEEPGLREVRQEPVSALVLRLCAERKQFGAADPLHQRHS